MSYYDGREDELIQDTKQFLKSEYGKYVVEILRDKARGHLSEGSNMDAPYPERYIAKYSATKEVHDLIYQLLDDDVPPLG